MAKRPTFERACAQYLHRFTMDHVPNWATKPLDGRYYAPQFTSDRDWYEHTLFKGDPGYNSIGGDCYTTGQTWPLGQWLDSPFRIVADIALEAISKPAKPSYDELLDMLDNVSASLDSVMLAHGASMTEGDRVARAKLASAARAVCDALLREEEDENPFHPESPEGRAWESGDRSSIAQEPDWIALAKDAGYDGSPGGEREWCIGNGMGVEE
jgi:hypothetical protein